MKTWIVLYTHRDRRFASFENTPENIADLKRQLNMMLMQRDVNGTEHYKVYGTINTVRGQRLFTERRKVSA
jgi:hypothetical protein